MQTIGTFRGCLGFSIYIVMSVTLRVIHYSRSRYDCD